MVGEDFRLPSSSKAQLLNANNTEATIDAFHIFSPVGKLF